MHLNWFSKKYILQDSKGNVIWHIWMESLTVFYFILSDLVRTQINQSMKIKYIKPQNILSWFILTSV